MVVLFNMNRIILLYILLLLGIVEVVRMQSSFNAAFRKPVEANTTCGSPSEKYYKIQDATKLPSKRTILTCNASDPLEAQPPSYLVDGSLATYWQSRRSVETAYVSIDLQQMFFAYKIVIRIGDHRRPGTLMISKSSDHGVTFSAWQYLVSETSQCQTVFGVQFYGRGVKIDRVDRVLCQQYSMYPASYSNENITVELNGKLRGDGTPDSHAPGLLAWMNVTNVMFRFSQMHLELDRWEDSLNHYTVREIQVEARCDCNGHADGNVCRYNETTNRRACVCQANTCGENCQTCCPLYNQILWTKGAKAPWQFDNSSACEACNCHNHSDACAYNQTVNDLGLSLDTQGRRRGGGVCLDCKHHTHGINCEKCETYYYRPVGRGQAEQDSCQACLCDVRGSTNVTGVVFLSCVTDLNETALYPGKKPGDCFCKDRVEGRQCNNCKPNYYRLARENPAGCLDCNCNINGTVISSNICNANYTGQCPCKANVELRDCSQCKHGYYDLKNTITDGCSSCACDEGSTFPANTCDKVTGHCRCRTALTGKQCKSVQYGYYYPDLHFIQATKDPYQPATDQLHVLLTIPKSGKFRVLAGYTLNTGDGSVNVSLSSLNNPGAAGRSDQVNLSRCSANCKLTKLFTTDISLSEGTWIVNITGNNTNLKLDRVIAFPEEFHKGSILGTKQPMFLFTCEPESYAMGISESSSDAGNKLCRSAVFSITTAYLNGSLPCACNALGSSNQTCNPSGGQCPCKTGVEGRDCGRCRPGFFNFTSEGCQPCGCKGSNNVCNPVTGVCECLANTVGRTCESCQCNNRTNKCMRTGECLDCQHNTTGFYCDQCVNGTYGNASKQQCQECGCNTNGSFGSHCDRITGQCMCKTNVMGRNCSQCKPNTYRFGSTGCSECDCNVYGSANSQCDANGTCTCKTATNGTKCTQCISGYYGLPRMSCTDCACNANGTVNGSVCASDADGQCHCKNGVTGRACDRCTKFFTNFSSSGCQGCPACVQALMQMVDETRTTLNTGYSKGQTLTDLTVMHTPLDQTEKTTERTTVAANGFDSRTTRAQSDYQNLKNTSLVSANDSYLELEKRATGVRNFASEMLTNTTAALSKTTLIHSQTSTGMQFIRSVDELIKDIVNEFATQTSLGTKALAESENAVSKIMVRDFSHDTARLSNQTASAENLTAHVRAMARRLLAQTSLSRELNAHVQNSSQNLTELQMEWNRTHVLFLTSIDNVTQHFVVVREFMNQTQDLIRRESQTLESVKAISKETDDALNLTQNTIRRATTAYEQYKSMVSSVSGDLQVSMLQYDVTNQQLMVKVLKGRNLAPRDLPSGTSNPYIILSINPTWGNQATQRSTIINDTLNPEWQFSEIYRFNLSPDQLQQTKLKLRVYDYDSEDEDDFMGEVIIDLATVANKLNNIFTEWYKIQAQDLSQLSSGNFHPSSGLVDVSNLLQTQLEGIKHTLGSAEISLLEAQKHVEQLRSLAEQMKKEFNGSHTHGAASLDAINQYTGIEKIVNTSTDNLALAKSAVERLSMALRNTSMSELSTMAMNESQVMAAFYMATIGRNLTERENAHIEKAILEANATFLRAVSQWYEAYNQFPTLRATAVRLQAAASEASGVVEPLARAQRKSDVSLATVNALTVELAGLDRLITVLQEKITFLKAAAINQTSYVDEAFALVRNASSKLTNEPTPSTNVLNALAVQRELQGERHTTEVKLDSLEVKLNALKKKMSEAPLAMQLSGETLVEYEISNRTLASPVKNDIAMTIRSNSSKGLLLGMLGEQNEPHLARRDVINSAEQKGIVLYILDDKVHVEFNVGQGLVVIINPVKVNREQWTKIYFTRLGSTGTLTVLTPSEKKTLTKTSSPINAKAEINFSRGTNVIVGGVPTSGSSSLNKAIGNYNGIINNIELNEETLNLFNTKKIDGIQHYALPQYPNRFYLDNGEAASFSGAGYTQQAVDDFNTSSGYVAVELDFRTHSSNGILVAVTDKEQQYIFVLFLRAGKVHFQTVGSRSDNKLIAESKRSDYNNGDWYRVKAERNVSHSDTNSTLTVTALGLEGTRDLTRGSDTAASSTRQNTGQPNRSWITFGGPSPNSNEILPVTDYAGDMKKVKLYLNTIASTAISFKSSISSKGVFTNKVYKGKTEGGATRFYGIVQASDTCSYATMGSLESSTVTSITFTFKTTEINGLLLYSEANVSKHSVILYVALFHGDLLVLTHNTSSNQSEPFMTSNMTFSDNMWREVHLNSTDAGYSLYVNRSLVHTGWFGTSRKHPLVLGRPVYVGGVPPGVRVNLSAVVDWCFTVDMKNFKVDLSPISLVLGEGTSNAGVLPAKVPAPPTPLPPTCAAVLSPLTTSPNAKEASFSPGLGSVQQSYMGFSFGDGYITVNSFLFTLEFRPLSANGLLLYVADNHTHPEQFVSIEIVNGHLKYQFNLGPGHVQMNTAIKYVGDGKWVRAYALRITDFGAMLIPESKEYQKDKYAGSIRNMTSLRAPLYIGGVPPSVKLHPLVAKRSGFSGCFRSLAVASDNEPEHEFDLAAPQVKSGITDCYRNVKPGMAFNGSAWLKFDNIAARQAAFDVRLEFRTSSRDGVLLYLVNSSSTKGNNTSYLKLEQNSGQIVLTFGNESGVTHRAMWSDPAQGNATTSSYLLCQMAWHTLRLTRTGLSFSLTLDTFPASSVQVSEEVTLEGSLFLGGLPAAMVTQGSPQGFRGCIKTFTLNSEILDLSNAAEGMHAVNGCPV